MSGHAILNSNMKLYVMIPLVLFIRFDLEWHRRMEFKVINTLTFICQKEVKLGHTL